MIVLVWIFNKTFFTNILWKKQNNNVWYLYSFY